MVIANKTCFCEILSAIQSDFHGVYHLDLSGCRLHRPSPGFLCRVLQYDLALTHLTLDSCTLDVQDLSLILRAIKSKQALKGEII